MGNIKELTKGIIKENPTLVGLLGMCPTLAVTTQAVNGIGMGLGFTVGLTAIGIVRELLGAGEVFGIRVMPQSYEPLTIFVLAPGAFFVLACLVALQNKVKANLEKKGKKVPVSSGCGEGCSACASKGICGGHLAENEPHHEETNVKEEEEA